MTDTSDPADAATWDALFDGPTMTDTPLPPDPIDEWPFLDTSAFADPAPPDHEEPHDA
jgi:hypothetical protein